MHTLINAECLAYLNETDQVWDTIFADPPDNIGLKYKSYNDRLTDTQYEDALHRWLSCFIKRATTVWFSYNAKWTFSLAPIINDITHAYPISAKLCIQTFTFGQCNQHDLGNNYRPLLRLRWKDAPLFPNSIRVPSWRQQHGDKRADPRGRVPGDVFDVPRVTGNSKERRGWHPTQLGERLVGRCIKLTTPSGGTVLDPFAGTGTAIRVCKCLNMGCTSIEIDPFYCQKIADEHGLEIK